MVLSNFLFNFDEVYLLIGDKYIDADVNMIYKNI